MCRKRCTHSFCYETNLECKEKKSRKPFHDRGRYHIETSHETIKDQ